MSTKPRSWYRVAWCLAILAGVATSGQARTGGKTASEPGVKPTTPTAVVADLSGNVWIRRDHSNAPSLATLGERLRVGDTLHTDEGASASIFLAGGQIVEILEGSRIRITKDLAAPDSEHRLTKVSARTLEVLERGLWVVRDPRGSHLVGAMRGEREGSVAERARLLSPRREVVPDSHPTFVWAGAPMDVRVVVARREKDVLHSVRASGSQWRVPPSQAAFEPGTYSWWIESADGNQRLTRPEQFEIASSDVRGDSTTFEKEMTDLESSAGHTLAGFLRCTYYQELGAWSRVVRAAGRFSDDPAHAVFARRSLLVSGKQMGLDQESLSLLLSTRGVPPDKEGA